MNISAYSILDTLGLKRPRTFELESLLSLNDSRIYFVRTKQGAKIENFIKASEFKCSKDQYFKLLKNHAIIQIEEGILSNIGGCAVVHGDAIYTEIVLGHLSGLLLEGWLSLRTLKVEEQSFNKMISQSLMIEQTYEKNRKIKTGKFSNSVLRTISELVTTQLSKIDSHLLFEFIVDSDHNIYFVDVKDFPYNINYLNVFSGGMDNKLIYSRDDLLTGIIGSIDNHSNIYKGDFRIANESKIGPNTILSLNDYPLLSHFVTRGLSRSLNLIIT